MLPESVSFSDDTTMKSSGQKGSFGDLNFLMEKLDLRLGEIYCQFDAVSIYFFIFFLTNIVSESENKGDGTLALLKILRVSSGIDILILIYLFGTGKNDENNINKRFENSDFERM